jgi:hypothetical protein
MSNNGLLIVNSDTLFGVSIYDIYHNVNISYSGYVLNRMYVSATEAVIFLR